MTKAVGDFLGTNGIADEMIRFNGFPFLEKEDHAYNVSGEISLGILIVSKLTPLKSIQSHANGPSYTIGNWTTSSGYRYVHNSGYHSLWRSFNLLTALQRRRLQALMSMDFLLLFRPTVREPSLAT